MLKVLPLDVGDIQKRRKLLGAVPSGSIPAGLEGSPAFLPVSLLFDAGLVCNMILLRWLSSSLVEHKESFH